MIEPHTLVTLPYTIIINGCECKAGMEFKTVLPTNTRPVKHRQTRIIIAENHFHMLAGGGCIDVPTQDLKLVEEDRHNAVDFITGKPSLLDRFKGLFK